MPRHDISDKLTHFTSPRENWQEACGRLAGILEARTIRAGDGNVRGGHTCVCFTEAPLASLPGRLVNPDNYSRYAPFGIILEKAWLFERGGRPVIYQTPAEYGELPSSHQWRHVRYEPAAQPPIDFSWEREWRIRGDVVFQPNDISIVVPTQEWADNLRDYHEWREDMQVEMYSMMIDQDIAHQYREEFPWRVQILDQRQ